MRRNSVRHTLASGMAAIGLALAATTAGAQQAPRGGLSQTQMDDLSHKHDGFYGALSPQNLNKKRPKPPFNMTGTWFIDLSQANGHKFADFMYGPNYPEFYDAGKQAMVEAAAAAKDHKPYRDSIGECFPAGMPMIMTRVWPIGIIQLPTAVWMTFGFTNSFRVIYLDGRKHTDPDIVSYTYNGESIGHWEGKTLVVDIAYLEPKEHYIDMGIPVSDQFHITERITLLNHGKTLQMVDVMTDPKNWKGEWKSTHQWIRVDQSDIPEVECLPNMNKNLPSTEEGQAALKEREKAAAAAAAAPAAPKP